MLYHIKTNRVIDDIPYRDEYDVWRGRLTDTEYKAIIDELASKIGNTEIQTSSWMPGKNWANTVFDPIYSKACNCDYVQAAKFFGLLVWETFLNHKDYWAFDHYELDGKPINGLTYFKVQPRIIKI